MDIRRFTPDDTDTVGAVVDLTNAVRRTDAPFQHETTVLGYIGYLRHGWDGEVPETYAAWEGDRLVGTVSVHTSEWDNTHLAWVDPVVHPDKRREGRGSSLLQFAADRSRELGRTSLGTDAWEAPHVFAFTGKHDLPQKSAAIMRRMTLPHVDREMVDKLYDEASRAASSYELVRLVGRTPEDLLPAVAEMTAAINDAPTDDLDIEDEVFPVERIVAYETAQAARDHTMYRVLARHRETGELAGHTVVCVERERPHIGDQHDTSVVRSHRGHRLGLLLKADMVRWLAESEPGLETIDTWNAESNDHMIAVNAALGYEVMGRGLQFQRDL